MTTSLRKHLEHGESKKNRKEYWKRYGLKSFKVCLQACPFVLSIEVATKNVRCLPSLPARLVFNVQSCSSCLRMSGSTGPFSHHLALCRVAWKVAQSLNAFWAKLYEGSQINPHSHSWPRLLKAPTQQYSSTVLRTISPWQSSFQRLRGYALTRHIELLLQNLKHRGNMIRLTQSGLGTKSICPWSEALWFKMV